MAKWFGVIGYALERETAKGVVSFNDIIERPYYGDLTSNIYKWEQSENLNDDLNIQDNISILADEYAYNHVSSMRYATVNGVKWKVKSVSISRPRITLALGGVYNEQ